MRALVVGAGAVGCYLAARLRMGGHDVALLGRSRSVDAIRTDGITLRVGNDEWPVSVEAAADTSDLAMRAPFELAIVAVKSFSTQEAIASLQVIPGAAGSTILSVQNGIGNEEALAAAFGADRIAAGALTTAVESKSASVVAASAKGGLSFAPVGTTPHNWLIAAMEHTGLRLRAAGDWRALKWSKLCINVIANGVCAALDWTPAQVYANAIAYAIERETMVEAAAVMARLGISPLSLVDFPVPLLVAAVRTLPASMLHAVLVRRVTTARGDKLPSLLMDLRAGRTTSEVVDLNGAVSTAANGAGMSAPANAAVARVVAGIAAKEIAWDSYRGKPQALLDEVRA